MEISEIKKHELFINNLWAMLLAEQWDMKSFSEVHQGIMDEYADMFISYEDLKYCVENKVPFDVFEKWTNLSIYKNLNQNLNNYVNFGEIVN